MTSTNASRAMPWALIGAACLGSFAATSAGTTRAPFLLAMSNDLGVPMPLVANLVTVTSIAWAITSALGGWASDRMGRRTLLVGAPLALALSVALQGVSGDFIALAAWATMGGAASGVVMGLLFAEVAAHVEDHQRGRALGWVMSGQSLTLLIGVPMAAAVGSIIGWRGWLFCVTGLAAAASVALYVTVPRAPPVGEGSLRRTGLRGALSPRVLGLLSTGVAERVCYGLAAVYYATFLQMNYGLSIAALVLPLALFAAGNVVGTILGGQLADRLYDRLRTFAAAMALSGLVALVLFLWHPSELISIALGSLYVLINALGRPSLMASYAQVPDQIRGTVMGLSGAAASLGWCGAAGLGGVLLSFGGFDGFGPLALALGLAGAAGAMWCRRRYAI